MQKGVISALEVQKHDQERVSVFLDGEYAFSLSAIEAAKLHKGQQLSAADIERLRDADGVIRAVDSAARFLSYRPRSSQEIRRHLSDKEFTPETIDAALERLRALGYLDDVAFCRFWVENRTAFKPLGKRALRYELRQKGIADSIITEVLGEQDDRELAYQAAQPRINRLRGSSKAEFRKKLSDFLARRGFAFDVCREVIEQLAEELTASDPPFFATEDTDENLP